MNSDPLDQEQLDWLTYQDEEALFFMVHQQQHLCRVSASLFKENIWQPDAPVGNKAGRNGRVARLRVMLRPSPTTVGSEGPQVPTLVLCPWEGCVIRYRNASFRPEFEGKVSTPEEILSWVRMVHELTESPGE